MEITGTLIEKFDTQQISETFKKREFVIEYAENPKYPELIKFELIQDKCKILEKFEIGEVLSVAFNLKGREWTNKEGKACYFNTLQAWKINNAEGNKQQDEKIEKEDLVEMEKTLTEEPDNDSNNERGDIPF